MQRSSLTALLSALVVDLDLAFELGVVDEGRVKGEGSLGDEGSGEDDNGEDGELSKRKEGGEEESEWVSLETRARRRSDGGWEMKMAADLDSSNVDQRVVDVPVLPVDLVDVATEDGTEDGLREEGKGNAVGQSSRLRARLRDVRMNSRRG